MKSAFLSVILLLFASAASIGGPDLPWREGMASPRLETLKIQVKIGNSAAVKAFWEEMKVRHAPLVEPVPGDPGHLLVTFLYRAERPLKGVVLICQVTASRDPGDIVLTRLADTDVWYKTYLLRNDMRLTYSFVPGPTPESLAYQSEMQLRDPLNPLYLPDFANIGHSVLQLPDASPQPWIAPRPGVPAGKVEEIQVESKVLNSQRRAWIYLPAGYDANRSAPYPLLACFDGWVYTNPEWVPTPVIFDNLIHAGKIPPMIAVFIDQFPQPKRNLELSNNPEFADFVANELVPLVRKKWRATSDPAKTTLVAPAPAGWPALLLPFDIRMYSATFPRSQAHSGPARRLITRSTSGSRVNLKPHPGCRFASCCR